LLDQRERHGSGYWNVDYAESPLHGVANGVPVDRLFKRG
jgi:hypothetical protein